MECPNCHHQITTTGDVCPRCEAPLTGVAEAEEQPATVAAPQPGLPPARPQPPAGSRALYFNFDERPASIVRVMDDTRRRRDDFLEERARRRKLLLLLFPAGLPFIVADLVMGYNWCTLSLVALALWLGAVAGLLLLWRERPGNDFGPKYDLARALFATLKDDIAPRRTLSGWLDLTGMEQPGKVVRDTTSASGMPVKVYRDEWLRMKMSLFDGSLLRVSAFESTKKKTGRFKRGGSGKMKWRPGRTVWARNQVQVALTADPQAYEVEPVTRTQVGMFAVDATRSDASRVVLVATSQGSPAAADILSLLRFAHDHLKLRAAPAAAPAPAPAPAQ